MPIVSAATHPTLLDLAKRQDPDGKIAAIVEILNQTNEILLDMAWREGNLVTGHRTTMRTGIPTPTWRRINAGVAPTKSTTAQVTHNTGMLEAFSECDVAEADLNGNTADFRLSEAIPHIEGMNQEMAETLFYGNEGSEPAAFTGLAPHYNSLSADNAENIIDAGGAGVDNASIWLCVWSENTLFGIVPKGSIAGLQHEDLGKVMLQDVDGDGTGKRMMAYSDHFRWDSGLVVKDWRYTVRIANIDKSATLADASSGPKLHDLMFEAIERIPNLGAGMPVFYMSRYIRQRVRQQSSALVKNSTLTIEQIGGVPVMMYQGIPLRRVDALAADEAVVS